MRIIPNKLADRLTLRITGLFLDRDADVLF